MDTVSRPAKDHRPWRAQLEEARPSSPTSSIRTLSGYLRECASAAAGQRRHGLLPWSRRLAAMLPTNSDVQPRRMLQAPAGLAHPDRKCSSPIAPRHAGPDPQRCIPGGALLLRLEPDTSADPAGAVRRRTGPAQPGVDPCLADKALSLRGRSRCSPMRDVLSPDLSVLWPPVEAMAELDRRLRAGAGSGASMSAARCSPDAIPTR